MRVLLTSLVYGELVVTVTLIYNFVVIWPNVLSYGFIKKSVIEDRVIDPTCFHGYN